ncbi:MAG: DNA-3-methyladenine glycosylase 2 family protein [Archangiaceae bacterium]|nr:DNA-3-methyladenine glycosylase 2 family protein [Archangiaceae bacterium]
MHFELDPQGPFTLDVARTFACGLFTASRSCSTDGAVRFAFSRDDDFSLAGVKLGFDGQKVKGEAFGSTKGIERQVARIIGVDRDARPFYALAKRDPVLAEVLARTPGFRPVVFFSPWAAVGWGVLTQRLRMTQAARLAERLAREAGDVVEVDGEPLAAFPRPQTFLARSGFAGITDEKWARLQTVARAALEGELSFAALDREGARERLLKLRGVGPWTADMVLIRGVGPSDVLPDTEPTLHRAVAHRYGAKARLDEVSATWAPFRTWVSVMLVRDFRGQLPVLNG